MFCWNVNYKSRCKTFHRDRYLLHSSAQSNYRICDLRYCAHFWWCSATVFLSSLLLQERLRAPQPAPSHLMIPTITTPPFSWWGKQGEAGASVERCGVIASRQIQWAYWRWKPYSQKSEYQVFCPYWSLSLRGAEDEQERRVVWMNFGATNRDPFLTMATVL